jgi:hypothetical protein
MRTKFYKLSGIILVGLLCYGFSVSSIAQGMLVKSPTTLKVASGTTVVVPPKLSMESGAVLNNSGTIVLKGNLDNLNSSQSDLGTGTFVFSGTSHQYIIGLNKMNNVTVNNSKGLGILGNTEVDGALALTNGLVTLGSNNLLMGPSATVSGTTSVTNMVVATGSGELRKSWSANGSFIFPVGDSTGTVEYSPVTLNFTSGTYPANNYIGLSLQNTAYDPVYTGSYLNRYWVVTNTSSSPITGFSCNATFKYLPADVTGTESELYCTKVAPDPVVTYAATDAVNHVLTASGLTTLSTFTGTKGALVASLFAWLEGPYNTTNHNMNTTLNPLIPLNQPYNVAPWNYAGTESVGTMPADVVDWVLVSIRVAADGPSATSATQKGIMAALLKSDGSIVSTTGANLTFHNVAVPAGQYLFPVIKHRNHLGIMSNTGAIFASSIYSYDYRNASNKAYPGDGTGFKLLQTGAYGMFAGDANGDGSIQTIDKSLWVTNFNQTGYLVGGADFNLDGDVQTGDKAKWVANFNIDSTIP